jgi:D-mannonate dehydratase
MGHVEQLDETVITFARQLGIRGIQLHAPADLSARAGYWSAAELRALRERCEAAGLALDGLENVPAAHFAKIQRGQSGRDQQIENYQATIRNLAEAGIFLLGYNFLPTYVWRTDMDSPGRGGARVTAFDLTRAERGNALAGYKLTPGEALAEAISADQMRENHQCCQWPSRPGCAWRCTPTTRPWTFRWAGQRASSPRRSRWSRRSRPLVRVPPGASTCAWVRSRRWAARRLSTK